MRIRHLPETLINQIAAGEVIERPAAVIKELVENALDADATQIEIDIKDGGKSYMSVSDNGFGMSKEELTACLDRHATSKLPDEDLFHIQHLGFRGEALPSIASVSKMFISSFSTETQEAWEIKAEGGKKFEPVPSAHPIGTKIEIRDLFYATPARLKFLKTARSENSAIKDTVTRLAMTAPDTHFTLLLDGKRTLNLPPSSQEDRLGRLLGREFPVHAMPILAIRYDNLKIEGLASLPTFNKANSLSQYFFVNGRAVKDRLLLGALKGAYRDVLARDRYPIAALFITVPPEDVDVNVHPAKAEVRFKDAAHIRGLLVSAIRHALLEHGGRSAQSLNATHIANDKYTSKPEHYNPLPYGRGNTAAVPMSYAQPNARMRNALSENVQNFYDPLFSVQPSARQEDPPTETEDAKDIDNFPLGAARAQIHENYIISQSDNGMVIIDQHAAHERLVYERLKTQQEQTGIQSQGLLTPEIIEIDPLHAAHLIEHQDALSKYGLEIESFGTGAISVAALPALLGEKVDVKALILDLSDELEEHGTLETLQEKILAILSRRSCHGSIRSGRRMNGDEMNHLLREMEQTPLSGQCNHGRPTYVKLSLSEIEKLFKRR